MNRSSHFVEPPAPVPLQRDLGPLKLLFESVRNSLTIWPEHAFDVPFARNTLFGVENLLINNPAGVRHVLAANASNYVRPAMMSRIIRPLIGNGLFLSEGTAWRQQRRLLSPSFTPMSVNLLLRHFQAAADDLVETLGDKATADLSYCYQRAALDAVLRALFSMPDARERDELGNLVRSYLAGPGRPQIFDGFAKSESSFSFALGGRRAFQREWFDRVEAIVNSRRKASENADHRDLLDLLIFSRDPVSDQPLSASEIRDQCATMIFAGYETTARLLFWASYVLTLDIAEQVRLRNEVAAFPPERVSNLGDLDHWPRMRLVLLETLRLYPPVPLLVREAVEEDVIMGEPVGRGVQVYIAPWVLHRHRAHWENPTAFLPERFAGQTAPWTAGGAYLPFGAGPRICIGAAFALAEAQIILAKVLSRFQLSTADKTPVMPVGRLTIQPSFAPNFRLHR